MQKVGVCYVISYTKRNLDFITLIVTLLIFINLHFFFLLFVSLNFYQNKPIFSSYQVYSKTIPVQNEKANHLINNVSLKEKEKSAQVETLAIEEDKNTENIVTQRDIIQENKDNPWRIKIPRINLDVHIEEGTDYDTLLKAVGHFEETSTWNGNVGLAGHNRGYQCNFFQKLKDLKIGDEIIYFTTNGKRVYKVQTNKIIEETDWSYLEPTQDNRMTLITCVEDRKQYRRCIQAIEVASYQF